MKPLALCPVAALTAAKYRVITEAEYDADEVAGAHKSALIWIREGRKIGLNGLEISSALSRQTGYVPAEQMLDVPAHHMGFITRRDGSGIDLSETYADEIAAECGGDFFVPTLGYFDNPLNHDPVIRKQVHEHTFRAGRAAKMLKDRGLKTRGVAGFAGRNVKECLQRNIGLFEEWFIPILRYFDELGIKFFLENCHMCGWDPSDGYVKNLGSTAGLIITLRQIADKHGLGHVLKSHFDESHQLSQGSTAHEFFSALVAAGYGDMVETAHLKDLIRNLAAAAVHTVRGQEHDLKGNVGGNPVRMQEDDGTLSTIPAVLGAAWGRYVGEHSHIGIGHWNLMAMLMRYQADWVQHQIDIRTLLKRDPEDTWLIIEHELQRGVRDADFSVILEMISIVANALRGADMMAASYAYAPTFAANNNFELPGFPNPMLEIPGLAGAVAALKRD